TCSRIVATNGSRARRASRNPSGIEAACGGEPPASTRMSFSIRAGCASAARPAIAPPSRMPPSTQRSMPSLSERNEQPDIVLERIDAVRRGPGEPETREVVADDPAPGFQRLDPPVPGMERGAGAVQQNDRAWILTRALVAQVHVKAADRDEHR